MLVENVTMRHTVCHPREDLQINSESGTGSDYLRSTLEIWARISDSIQKMCFSTSKNQNLAHFEQLSRSANQFVIKGKHRRAFLEEGMAQDISGASWKFGHAFRNPSEKMFLLSSITRTVSSIKLCNAISMVSGIVYC